MNSFWKNLYDSAKDRRYAVLFVTTLVLGSVSAVLGSKLERWLKNGTVDKWPLLAFLGIASIAIPIQFFRRDKRGGWKRQPLSSDELRAARSKLLKR